MTSLFKIADVNAGYVYSNTKFIFMFWQEKVCKYNNIF